MSQIKKPVAIVTGASSGIGLITARKLAKAGYRVFGTSRHLSPGKNHEFEMLQLDVDDNQSAVALIQQVFDLTGRIDLLVNNAGRSLSPAAAEESSVEQAQSLFNTNFFGVIRLTNAVLPYMRTQGQGRIVNVGSVLGFMPTPYYALYSATKFALRAYSESLDHEVRNQGIRVTVIEPAFMKTSIDANSQPADLAKGLYDQARSSIEKRVAELLDQAEEPEVVADVILTAAKASKPKLTYTAGKVAARLKLMNVALPSKLLDAGVRKQFRLR